jgi:hypothetical protein
VKARAKLARELVVGDYIVTAIGYAPIASITPYRGCLDVHLDIRHERSTRPASETAILCLYPGEKVRFRPGTDAPAPNEARRDALDHPPAFLRRATGQESGGVQ